MKAYFGSHFSRLCSVSIFFLWVYSQVTCPTAEHGRSKPFISQDREQREKEVGGSHNFFTINDICASLIHLPSTASQEPGL